MIRSHVMAELPFMATEKILMECCKVRLVSAWARIISTFLHSRPVVCGISLASAGHSHVPFTQSGLRVHWRCAVPLDEQKGGDRQRLHHLIREHSMDAGKVSLVPDFETSESLRISSVQRELLEQ